MKIFFSTTTLLLLFTQCFAQDAGRPLFAPPNCDKLDNRSPEAIQQVERDIKKWENQNKSSGSQVLTIPTVVHVLWNNTSENIPDQQIFDQLETLNEDFRRQNPDTNYTQTAYLPIAADTEIEFELASTDPWGNPTNGITRTYTDSTVFIAYEEHMKFDSTGGKTAWNSCRYMNIWTCHITNQDLPGTLLGYGTFPGTAATTDGIVIRPDMVGDSIRTLTDITANYLNLYYFETPNCINRDSVADTPIQSFSSLFECPSTDTTIISCNNGPVGNLYSNFMSYSNCNTMFTQGQADRMRATLNTVRNGLIDPSACGPNSIDEHENISFEVYPSINRGQFWLATGERSIEGELSILNTAGQIVFTHSFSKEKVAVDISSQPSGIYFLQVNTDSHNWQGKIIKL